MAIVMWVTGNKKAMVRAARAMALVMRVGCNKEGNGNGGKNDGSRNKGGR